ncbi:MAG: amidohydrolase family protein [Gemmatimonadetes bacterium]|nr:amidohydrolase family protein [Gemmatimonadota bacterium]MYE95717.1 amidohydrolase family protein [Gemmatimonadota bacterium]MYJ10327.1 amidohydrolase family protein [Gemmatimonadota bacterium]
MTARRRWRSVAGACDAARHGWPDPASPRARLRLPGRRATLLLALGFSLAALPACAPAPPAEPAEDLVVYGARVWDGTGAELGEPAVLRIAAGRILSVEPLSGDADVAAAAEAAGVPAIDATGQFIIPGLINVHGHVGGTWIPGSGVDYPDYAVSELARYARFGVTTVNSLGGDREPVFAIRDASWGAGAEVGAGAAEGADLLRGSPHARLLVAGPVVTGASPEEVTAGVDAAAAMGPDWIKIRVDDNLGTSTKMSPESYGAVIARAAEHGLRVASHLFYHEDAKGLLRAGTGMVAHSIRDEAVDEETIGLFHETGVCYVPTLTREVSTYAYGGRPDFFDDPFLMSDVDSAQVMTVSDPARQERIRASGAAEAYGRALEIALSNLALLAEAGVPIAFGTDSGPVGRFQGYFEHMEMTLMAEAGLSPAQILRSATGVAADCLDREDIGTLEPGRRADFVLLRANPVENVANARSIEGVWVGGERTDGSRRF